MIKDLLKENRVMVVRILSAIVVLAIGIILQNIIEVASQYIWLSIYLPVYILIGYEVIFKAMKNILRGKVFDECFLMSIATIGAFVIGEFPEGVAVMIFYQIGELFTDIAVDRSRDSISSLMDIRPDYANIKDGTGDSKVEPASVHIGDIIVIKPGEKVPLDCAITKGYSSIDNKSLTGESLPLTVGVGSWLLSGSVNLSGVVEAEVTKEYKDSTSSKILELVENASSHKSKAENFITKFARWYTPLVVVVALLLAIIPSLITGEWSVWVYRALSFLVVSCPCALVISVPLSFYGGLGNASRLGALIKGANYLEVLSKVNTIVMDKTGTLTKGVFEVQGVKAIGIDERELLEYVSYAECNSSHPIAQSIVKAYGKNISKDRITTCEEIAGNGVIAVIDGKQVLVGNAKLMEEYKIDYSVADEVGTICMVAIDSVYKGYIVVADSIKEESREAISRIRQSGAMRVVMLTGDNDAVASSIAKELGIEEMYSELLPADKVERIEEIIKSNTGGKTIYVGDGINDAPVLARADVGIAMGGVGSDSAIEASDIVFMNDDLSLIPKILKLSKKNIVIVKQNIVFSLLIKGIILVLVALGIANMWLAVFADVGVSLIAILNAVRVLRLKY